MHTNNYQWESLVHQTYSKLLCMTDILNHPFFGCASIAGSDVLAGRCRASCGKYCHLLGAGGDETDA